MSFGFQITFSAPGICLFLAKFYFLFLRKPTQKKKKKWGWGFHSAVQTSDGASFSNLGVHMIEVSLLGS